MLVELATEGNGEVARCSAGHCAGGVQGFATIVGAPALTDLHVLEAGLHTGENGVTVFQRLYLNKDPPPNKVQQRLIKPSSQRSLTVSCGDNP